MANYLTFGTIVTEVERIVKRLKSTNTDEVKAAINMVYLSEVLSIDDVYPLFWLVEYNNQLSAVGPSSISAITQANPGVFTTSATHGLSVGDLVTFHNVGGMTEIDKKIVQVATVPTTTTFSTNLNTSTYTAFTSGGTVNHRGVTLSTSLSAETIISAGWEDYTPPMKPVTMEEIENDSSFQNEDTTGGPPQKFWHGKDYTAGTETDQIWWSPAASDSYYLRLWYTKTVDRLSADSDVPILPNRFHDILISGAVVRLAEGPRGADSPGTWPAIYSGHIGALKQFNREYWEKQLRGQQKKPYLL